MIDELNKDYIKLARVKGLETKKIMTRHVLRNAFVPIAQYLPQSILSTIGGSLLVERFFSVPCHGSSADRLDQPLRHKRCYRHW